MVKIGEFAWLGQVSVETLRHYDRVGLLKPAEVDCFTGYRRYGIDQLPRLNRILALRDLGLPLDQIAHVLDEDLTADEIRGMLRLKQAELENQVQDARIRLTRVEARIKQIEMEGKMPDYEVVVKAVESQRVAFQREVVPTWDDVPKTIGRMFDEVSRWIQSHGLKQTGPAISVWHVCKDDRTDTDIEAAVPIDRDVPGDDTVGVHDLPAQHAATVVHHGPFETCEKAYQAGFAWLEQNGHTVTGPLREVYLNYEDDGDPADYVTEYQFPIRGS